MKSLLLATTLLLATGAFAAPAVETPSAVALSLYETKTQAARAQFEAKDFAGAQKTMEAALELAQTPKEKSDALRRLGQALDGQKKYREAREAWQKMLPLIPDAPDDLYLARLFIASTYSNEKMWEQVVDALPSLIDDPHTEQKSVLRFQMATAYSELKQGEKARALVSLIMTDESSPKELRDLAQFVIGESYFNESNFDAARQSFEATTKIKGVSGEVLINAYSSLGGIAEKQNRADDAQAAFTQTRSLLMQKADGQFKAKDFAGAIVSYKQALATGIPEPQTELVAHMQLGTAYQSLGDTGSAVAEFKYIVDTDPIAADAAQPNVLKMLKPLALMGLAKGYIAQKKFEPARDALNRFMEYDDMLAMLYRKEAEALLKNLPPAN